MVGFDDIPMAAFTVPALTTMRMPTAEMAAAAVALAVGGRLGENPTPNPGDHPPGAPAETGSPVRRGGALVRVFRPELVVRESTATCPPDAERDERLAASGHGAGGAPRGHGRVTSRAAAHRP